MPNPTQVADRLDLQVSQPAVLISWSSASAAVVDLITIEAPSRVEHAPSLRALYERLAREYDEMPQGRHFPHDPLVEADSQ